MGRSQILHVTDDPNDVLRVRQACGKAGLNCEWQALNDGDEAIAYFQGADKFADRDQYPLPNLVLLDLKMARLSGFDVLAWLRQDAKWHSRPVVVLTSSNQEADVQRAYSLGANSYLVKPVDFEKLVEIVQAVHHYWLNFNVLPDAHLPSSPATLGTQAHSHRSRRRESALTSIRKECPASRRQLRFTGLCHLPRLRTLDLGPWTS